MVGHLVEEAPVDFVADACEYGNGVVRYGAAKGFAVEEGEVCLGAAAAYDANHVQFGVIAKCSNASMTLDSVSLPCIFA